MEKHLLFICGLVLISLFDVGKAVKINSITVPKRYELHGNDTIQLDCDFDVDPNETGFVLKWLHNNVPIYQWIPSKKAPFALGAFKNRVDIVNTSNTDRFKKHSALIIIKPVLTDSGNFTCNVQTFQGSDKQSADMQVIDPEDSIKLEYEFSSNNSVNFKCSVTKIYPVPTVRFLFDNEEKQDLIVETEEKENDGVTDITITTSVLKSEIRDESPVTCEVSLPSNYTKRETVTYDDPKQSPTTKQILLGEITKFTQSEADAESDAKSLQSCFGLLAAALTTLWFSRN